MNYELAKQLKDAGFHQSRIEAGGFEAKELRGYFMADTNKQEESVYIPTLEELIEACIVDGDFHLEAGHGEWQASVCVNKKGQFEDWHGGKTPTEAVANLWLALNRK